MTLPEESSVAFEEAYQKLEDTVQALGKGGLTLEQATALYEEGMRLARLCTQRLDSAELKITELQNAFLNQPSLIKEEDEHDSAP